jgi:hypothetical protein
MTTPAVHARRVRAALAALALLATFCQGCATLRVPELVPEASISGTAEVSGRAAAVTVSARPIARLDEYRSLFDEDLPKIGLAAVVVTVRNDGPSDYDAGRLRLRLRSATGRNSPALGTEGVLKAYYSGRGMRAYTVRSHEETTKALERVRLKPALLGPGGEVSGLMFFRIAPAPADGWTHGARLSVRGLPRTEGRDPLELVLDNARR